MEGKTTKDGSVEVHISDGCKEFFGAESGMLHGSGREDIDVRMLGRGRPFVMEF
jgi:tRNA pseudouridine synthase 10